MVAFLFGGNVKDISIARHERSIWKGVVLSTEHDYSLNIICVGSNVQLFKKDGVWSNEKCITCKEEKLNDPDFLTLKHMTGETTLTLKELDILYNMHLYLTDKITEQDLRNIVANLI